MTPEQKVKQQVCKILASYGAYWFMPVANPFQRRGVPDIIACVRGKFLGIECKAGTNTPTKTQEYEMNLIRAAGGCAIVINEHTMGELSKCIESIIR